jgi:hypothetical protein
MILGVKLIHDVGGEVAILDFTTGGRSATLAL